MSEPAAIRITITGQLRPEYVPGITERIMEITPDNAGFTVQVGTHATNQSDGDS